MQGCKIRENGENPVGLGVGQTDTNVALQTSRKI